MPLSGKSQKSPAELVNLLKEAIVSLGAGGEINEKKLQDDIGKSLLTIKKMITGGEQLQSARDLMMEKLMQNFHSCNLFSLFLENVLLIDFEIKKIYVFIFNVMVKEQIGDRFPTAEYISANSYLLFTLLEGYEHSYPEVGLNTGHMLRACITNENLAKILLYSEDFYKFFQYVEAKTFDIAADAFWTFKELLTTHKSLSAKFFEANFEKFFMKKYYRLLKSDNYVTCRSSIELLVGLLLDPPNFNVMTRYVSMPKNLKVIMNLLANESAHIKFEAFHVFKIFVANPNKPKPVLDILLHNQSKLVEFLNDFLEDHTEADFNGDKAILIQQIKELKAPRSKE